MGALGWSVGVTLCNERLMCWLYGRVSEDKVELTHDLRLCVLVVGCEVVVTIGLYI